ncbi:MAG: shikimate dehydrogenase [Ruminococcaceae bacterium]|nr:shikimate dehydrogenase [Oscillospiraceae bacterium]
MPMSSAYCLIGHPLGHSLSPFIHKRLFELSGRDASYRLQDIAPESFERDIPALLRQIGGCNVTIPYKQKILPFLDRIEGKAALYQTVNTVAVTESGTVGYNTDADGFLCALREAAIPLEGRVLILGAGGAGTVLAFEAALAGCRIVSYDPFAPEASVRLCNRLREAVPHVECEAVTVLPDGAFDLLINASPVGMYPHTDACPLPDDRLAQCAAVFDVIYNPRQTQLLQKAAANGAKTAGGMAMLVWQAAIAHKLWFGADFQPADIAALIDDCYAELASF